jgi:hypothetical protein|tara:strand:- start:374 stop:538 length:165 start_codon:yes stop_codon:yes gene_type:complete
LEVSLTAIIFLFPLSSFLFFSLLSLLSLPLVAVKSSDGQSGLPTQLQVVGTYHV